MRLAVIPFLVLAGPALGATDDPPPAEAARLLLEKAEAGAARGQYAKAVNTYEKIAKEWPQTPAGQVAARRTGTSGYVGHVDLVRNGPSRNRVDVAIMGDGFELGQQGDFDTLAKVAPRNFERHEVLEEYYAYHNFIRVNLRSKDSGVDQHGRDYDTALGAFKSGMAQGQVAVRPDLVRAMLAELPEHDSLAIVFVKNGDLGTGGNGVASVGGRDPKTMVHEWGHAFGGLMDEYTAFTGHRGLVRNGPNVSRTEDPEQVPWRHWLEARARGVKVYEGADGRPQGAWKPTTNCIMDVGMDFCPVCREAMVLRIHEFVDPIEGSTPPPHGGPADAIHVDMKLSVRQLEPVEFRVAVMQPKSHGVTAMWWVLPEEEAPRPSDPDVDRTLKDRRDRGPLPPIEARPLARSRRPKGGEHSFSVDPRDFEPGRYRVVCRVIDETRVRGSKGPWVLSDPAGLLQSERTWWLSLDQ